MFKKLKLGSGGIKCSPREFGIPQEKKAPEGKNTLGRNRIK